MPVLEFFVSPAGRLTRVVGGIAFIATGLLLGGWWLLLLPGALLTVSGAFDLCPLAIFVKKPVNGSRFRASCAL